MRMHDGYQCIGVFAVVSGYGHMHYRVRQTEKEKERQIESQRETPVSYRGLQELIGRLLVPDPAQRLSAEEVLADPWDPWLLWSCACGSGDACFGSSRVSTVSHGLSPYRCLHLPY